jgi:site-specific recombinase XerD
MQLGMIGLGRMGANMVRRLLRGGHQCVVFDMSSKAVAELAAEKAMGASSPEDLLKKLAKPRAVWHDLRHSFASIGLAGGDALAVIGALLGHTDPQTTLRYAHLADDPARMAANRISGAVAAAMDNKAGDSAPVLPMQKTSA